MLRAAEIYRELKDKLHELDKERVKFYNKVEPFRYVFWTVLILGGTFLIVRLNVTSFDNRFVKEENISFVIIAYGITVFITLIAFLAVNQHNKSKFKKMFTAEIAPYLIRGLDPSFKYDYEGQIPRMEVIASLLFPPFNTYECQDLVTGIINNVPIKFAELKLQKVIVKKDSKRYIPIFSGIFYRADLQSKFPVSIWLITKGNTRSIDEEGKIRIELDDPSIKGYRVYTDDETTARQVLQPFILQKIAELNRRLKSEKIISSPLSFHFEEHWVQIAIPTRKKFMEPTLSKTIDHISFIEEQIALLNAISTLMEDLTLK